MTIVLSNKEVELIIDLIHFAELNEFFESDGCDTGRCKQAAKTAERLQYRLVLDNSRIEYS